VDDEQDGRVPQLRLAIKLRWMLTTRGAAATPPVAEPKWFKVVVDDEGCRRSAVGRAEVVVDVEYSRYPPVAEPRWSST